MCGVPAQQIVDLARDYGTTKPAAIRLNYGMQRVRGGGNAVRAVACLPALVGAWRHRAGGLLLSSSGHFPVQRAALHRPDLLAGRSPRLLNMISVGDDLQRDTSPEFGPRIEALIVYNSNPVAVAPDSSQVVKGFEREDLFTVVLEHFQTDTADYADIILPATTQLEHWDVHAAYGHTDVMLNRPPSRRRAKPAATPTSSARWPPAWALTTPASATDDLSLCRTAFGDTVDFDTLLDQGYATLPVPDAPFAQGGFPTPSGRCEFASSRLAAQGIDPLPDHLPNHETAGSDARLPAGHDLAPGAQLPQLQLRQREEPARHRGRAAAGDARRRRRLARH